MIRVMKVICVLTLLLSPLAVNAAVIDFTGGTVTLLGGATATTNNSGNYDGVDYYEENGFRLDFVPNTGSTGFATQVGDYYSVGNDVIHTHWSSGSFGGVDAVEITKTGGGAFDLNYFILTSNTDTGGASASGNEMAWIEGFASSVSTGAAMMLPVEDWGLPGSTQIFLGSNFDAVDMARLFVTNSVDCFGMDEFYIDEAAPAVVPEPSTFVLLGVGLAGLGFFSRRRKKE